MPSISTDFLMGTEQECLTVYDGTDMVLLEFLETLASLAPSISAIPSGLFNAYGRVYVDQGHIELASAEVCSPILLAQVIEQQQWLVAKAMSVLKARGSMLLLANNNHSGLLSRSTATWGTHENYLVGVPPRTFADQILPFLVTRVLAGAGSVLSPTGNFVAGVRVEFIAREVGGGTCENRAIHSTAREQQLVGTGPWHRYHLVVGDGLRSQFSLALQTGTTALVLKAIAANPQCVGPLPRTPSGRPHVWLQALRRFNVLAQPGEPLRVHPLVIKVQHLYLDAAQRWANHVGEVPTWVPKILATWKRTLDALEKNDTDWLVRRLDPWIKHELFSEYLRRRGHQWKDAPCNRNLLAQLALLNQNYHEITNPNSLFNTLDQTGELDHRIAPFLLPGREDEPFVPLTGTRSRARARFIQNHATEQGIAANWDTVIDMSGDRSWSLNDPFAIEFESL